MMRSSLASILAPVLLAHAAAAQPVELIQLIDEGDPGLSQFQPEDVQLSPDGENAYVSSLRQGLIVFDRDPDTGELALPPLQSFCDASSTQCLPNSVELPFLGSQDGTRRIAVDPLGRYVYVTGFEGLNVFARDVANGQLAFLDVYEGELFVEQVPVYSYTGLKDVVVSPGGDHVYVVSDRVGGVGQASVTALAWAPIDGLERIQTLFDDFFIDLGIHDPRALAMSDDGDSLYVVSSGARAVATFHVDNGGMLSFQDSQCENGIALPACASAGVLSGFCDVAISPDSAHLYASCSGGTVVFDRNPNGSIAFGATALASGGRRAVFASDETLLDSPGTTLGSPDFRRVARNPVSGVLTVVDVFDEAGLGPARGLTVDSTGRFLNLGVPGAAAGRLAVYEIPEPDAELSLLSGFAALTMLARHRRRRSVIPIRQCPRLASVARTRAVAG